jgi:hypothetical protein
MEITMKTRFLLPGFLLIVSCFGCGFSDRVEEASVTSEPVVTGAQSISNLSDSLAEQETAAAAVGGFVAVGYNVQPAARVDEICFGLSKLGLSYLNPVDLGLGQVNQKWAALHLSTSGTGMATLRGDPSVAVIDTPGAYQVFVSNLATSVSLWNTQAKLADGCTLEGRTDSLCIATVSVPKNGTAASSSFRCVTTPGADYDGTAVTVLGGVPYVASHDSGADANTDSVHFFRGDGQEMRSPPVKNLYLHPIFVKNSPSELIIPQQHPAPDGNTIEFWLTTFFNNTWTPPVSMGKGNATVLAGNLPFGIRPAKEYASVFVSAPLSQGTTYLFYRDVTGGLVATSRSSGPGLSTPWHSPAGLQAFHPAVAVATIPNENSSGSIKLPGFHGMLSYWENSGSNGTAALKFAWLGAGQTATVATERPCVPTISGIWGDYDEMVVVNNLTAAPSFLRAFTDSTSALNQCASNTTIWSALTPQHISVISHPKF